MPKSSPKDVEEVQALLSDNLEAETVILRIGEHLSSQGRLIIEWVYKVDKIAFSRREHNERDVKHERP
jgi:hypothetical protein